MTVEIANPAPQTAARPLPEPMRSWAGERTAYPRDKTVVQIFEEVAARYGGKTALVFGETRVSYAELNRRANGVAQRLRRLGVRPETMVGVCLERSTEMIVALLGVLKAGAAFVPFDPGYPQERLDFMLADTAAPVIITQRSLESIAMARIVPILMEDEAGQARDGQETNPPSAAAADSLAYVMYTSGSTGRPKGVMVEHRSIVRLVSNTNFCRFGPEQVWLQYAPVSFDASTLEIWGALLHGATLVLMPPQACSLDQLGRAIREHGVTTLWLTAGLFHLFVEERLDDLRGVRQLIAGGDTLSARHVRRVLGELPETTLINGYGPTEGTTFTCCHRMQPGDPVPDAVPIGRPISNTRVYILDDGGNPAAPGIPGELWAAGDGVARGYLNAPELTAERFFPDPFASELFPEHSGECGARMYRTGDRARWRKDGVVEFLGRMDSQLKVLGHRIEPEEIEAALCRHPDVLRACLACRVEENGAKRLTAYFVSGNDSPSTSELREFLECKLPPYMVPAQFVELEALPLNANGKVDRGALASWPEKRQETPAHEAAGDAESELETAIAGVWKNVLDVSVIGLDDNFFDLGGDSLLLVAAHSQLQKALEIKIQVIDLFEFTTVRSLAGHLRAQMESRLESQPDSESGSEIGSTAAGEPAFAVMQQRAQKQREAFARRRTANQAAKGPIT